MVGLFQLTFIHDLNRSLPLTNQGTDNGPWSKCDKIAAVLFPCVNVHQ